MEVLKKKNTHLKKESPFDPAIPILVIYLEKTKTLIQKVHAPNVQRSIIYNSQDIEAI